MVRLLTVLVAGWCLGGALGAAAVGASWEGRAAVEFLGDSTLHKFTGHVASGVFTAQETVSGQDRLWSARVELDVAQMTTHHDGRDGKMRAMFDSGKHPLIVGVAENVPLGATRLAAADSGPTQFAQLPFELTIKGASQTVQASLTDWAEEDDRISFTLGFPVSLAKTGLRPPSVLGVIRVADVVHVRVVVSLARQE